MHVSARIDPNLANANEDCILFREAYVHPSQARESRAGTVLLTNVHIDASLRGEVIEAREKRIRPHKAVAEWPMLLYVNSLGRYVDKESGEVISNAKAVYMYGSSIFYLPAD